MLGFTRTGGGYWAEWDRFLTFDGKPAYHIGNICNSIAQPNTRREKRSTTAAT